MSLTFQNTSGSGLLFTLNDQCGNNNNGFNRGVTPFSMYGNPINTILTNTYVESSFDDDYMAGPDHSAVSPVSGVTLEAWVNPKEFPTNTSILNPIIHKGNSWGSVTDYRVEIQKNKIQLIINETIVFTYSNSTELFPLHQWTHFAITYSGSDGLIKFIRNGELEWEGTNLVGNIHDNDDSVYIGGTELMTAYIGYLDEVRIISSTLSYEEISNHVFTSINNLNDPSSTNVVYNFDGGLESNTNSGPRLFFRNFSQFDYKYASPLSFSSSLDFPEGFYMSNAGERIPSSGTSGFMISDTIDVPLNQTITDINVFVGLNHTDEDNLILSLISPSGTSVTLYSTSNLINNFDDIVTIFDDEADSSIGTYKYVSYLPTIKPLNKINSVLAGTNSMGKWKLKIQDAADSDTGRLYGWGIQFNHQTQRKKILSLRAIVQGFYDSQTNTMIQDSLHISIRDNASPYPVYDSDKRKLSDSGKADFVFNNVPDGVPIYIEAKHRNSITTWSKSPTSNNFKILNSKHFSPFTSFLKYDFTSASANAFGNNMIQVDNSPPRFAIFSGNVNQDDVIDVGDVLSVYNAIQNGAQGYVQQDVTGDNEVDVSDLIITYNNAINIVEVIKP